MTAQTGRMGYFEMLTQTEQRAAIARLAASGMSDYGLSAATQLSGEMVRKILGEIRAARAL